MQSGYTTHTDIILGYGGYIKKTGLLNLLVRYETIHTAMQYLSFALAGKPYMGVGRNLSYRKSLFYAEKGFSAHYTVHSGDDDLFINRVATKKNTRIEISKESHTWSPAKESWGQWIIQKRRHLNTSPHYTSSSRRLLGLYNVSKFGFFAALVPLTLWNYNPILYLPILGGYLLSLMLIVLLTGRKLNDGNLVLFAPIFDILLVIILPLIYLSNIVKRPERWK
jgi:hypothetical protein